MFSTIGLEHGNQRRRTGRTATKMTRATWRVAHGDSVVHGIVVVKISPSQPPLAPPSRNSMARPIGTVKTTE